MSSAQAGAALSPKNNSLRSFLVALAVNGAALTLEVAAFMYLHRKYTRIYSPRSFLPPPTKRSNPLPLGFFSWIPAVIKTPGKELIAKNGLDAYMLVRFLKILIMIFVPFTILTFAVIIPVDAVGMGGIGIARFTSGNITSEKSKRYSAHVIVAYVLTFYVLWLLRREMYRFVHLRHQFLISKSHAKLAQAKTVLITSLPSDLTTEADIRTFASFVPGGVARVWIYRDAPGLNEMYQQRLDACGKLEDAVAGLLRSATKAWKKQLQRDKKVHGKGDKKHNGVANGNGTTDLEASKELSPATILEKIKRPTHRVGYPYVPFVGEKVDTIEWCKNEIPKLNKAIENARLELPNAKPHGAAMIMCNLQMGAHVLAQCTSYHQPLVMVDKWIELSPEDVVWDNIDDGTVEVRGRFILSWIITVGLVILWSFPVAFVGTLSNIDQLCSNVHWLDWLCRLNPTLSGLIQGVLPPLFLAILFLILPFLLRGLAYFECIPRYSLISISVYRRYFLFLVIHGFIVVTLSSGLTSAIPQMIKDPNQIIHDLAKNLPSASTFFITYMIANGFTAAGGALLQLLPLVLHFIKRMLFGNTPRQAYNVEFVMPKTDLGTTLPRLSLLATIGIAYSIISPIICAFAAVSFSLLWFAWKFLMTWVMDQPEAQETGGMYFPLAVSNLFVGLYVEQLCLAALFFLSGSALPEAILMLVLLIATIVAHVSLRSAFKPITNYLPMSLATKEMLKRYQNREQAAAAAATQHPRGLPLPSAFGNVGEAVAHQAEETFDLFSAQTMKTLRRRLRLRRGRSSYSRAPEPGLDDHEHLNGQVNEKGRDEGTSAIKPDADSDPSEALDPGVAAMIERANEPVENETRERRPASRASVGTSEGSVSRHGSMKISAPRKGLNPGEDLENGHNDDDDEDVDEDVDEHAFDHPSTYRAAPFVWVPKDSLGLSDAILEELREAGVDASDLGASMNEKARVKVTRGPPDEDWIGGNDV